MTIYSEVQRIGQLRKGLVLPVVGLVQQALHAAGAQLVVDDKFGSTTEAAVERFQAAHGLSVVGYVGPKTAQLLDALLIFPSSPVDIPRPSVLATAPWLSVMRAITGTKEVPGAADSEIIMAWKGKMIARFPKLESGIRGYTHDEIPWCGFGMAYCLSEAGFMPPLEPLYALNFANHWADGIHLTTPSLGAIMVLSRNGGGHVTLYEGEDSTHWFGRGPNQSDMVNVAAFPHSRKPAGIMWPKGISLPTGGRVRTSFNAAVSIKEA